MRLFITKTHLPARGYSLMAEKCLTKEDIENIFNDSCSDDDAVSDCSETYSEMLEVKSSEESGEETDENDRSSIDTITAKDGTKWSLLRTSHAGRARASNVFKAMPGMIFCVRRQASESPYMAWKLFIDESIFRQVQNYTVIEARKQNSQCGVSSDLLEAFIALQYARGIYGKGHSLWNEMYGPKIFRETMPRNTFKSILRFLRFDDKSTRRGRLDTDKFTHIREIFEKFSYNCATKYTPTFSLTIDEKLMPMKNRCPFIVYMPNKPDKFGIKFWLLVEVESKYVVNLRPYLGAQEKESRQGVPLAQDVVLRLVSPVKSKGYNIITDNFFTSVALAEKLEALATIVVGTVRANSKGITKAMTAPVKGGTNKSTFYYNDKHHCLFVNYQCKIKKSVPSLNNPQLPFRR